MYPVLEAEEYCYKGVQVTINDIHVFRCVNCGEGILEADEVKRIEKILVQKANNNSKEGK
jgi:YgiT-type zinc finger domain-containing protein